MRDKKYYYLITPKLVIFSKDEDSVLLCQRKGEADYNGVYSFAGGKIETTDKDLTSGIKREKDEELGENFIIKINPSKTLNILYKKKDGDVIFVPHYFALHESGLISLNKEEYSNYKWVEIGRLKEFEPKIKNIYDITKDMLDNRVIFRKNLSLI